MSSDKTVEEVMAEADTAAAEAARKKVSLNQQIEEVEYELKQRASVYPRIVASNPGKRSELEYHVSRMEAVQATLEWVKANETVIRAAIAAASGAEQLVSKT